MPSFGFISDKLEIKFLILYIAAFSEGLADLVRTEHLHLEEGLYQITDKGRHNSSVC